VYNPDYSFRLFDIPNFSPLQAQEFGASTIIRPQDPTSYVDFALGQLGGLLQPGNAYPYPQQQFPTEIVPYPQPTYFQTPSGQTTIQQAQAAVDSAKAAYDAAVAKAKQVGGIPSDDCPQGRNILGGCGPIFGSKPLKSDDSSVGGSQGNVAKKIGDAIVALPSGSGMFLIAIIIIILLLLIAKR
jgi:hypothetical protein